MLCMLTGSARLICCQKLCFRPPTAPDRDLIPRITIARVRVHSVTVEPRHLSSSCGATGIFPWTLQMEQDIIFVRGQGQYTL